MSATTSLAPDRTRTPGATFALYRLMLRLVITRARVLSIGALGLVGVIVGATIGRVHNFEHLHRGAQFVNAFGISLLVPVATLVFASAALGDPTEDGTLVYLWLRPVARWRITAAAAAAAFTATWPVVTIPLAITAALASRDLSFVVGTVAAVTVVMVGYVGLFLALGLRVKRALVWGLLYIFIWEGFVATANVTAARLAVRTYGRSVLEQISHTRLRPTDISLPWSWIVPPLVALVALAYTCRRLARQDVA
jgi:ABC-2 type transport system permease protein